MEAGEVGEVFEAAGGEEEMLVEHLVEVEVGEGDVAAGQPGVGAQEDREGLEGGRQLLQVGALVGLEVRAVKQSDGRIPGAGGGQGGTVRGRVFP